MKRFIELWWGGVSVEPGVIDEDSIICFTQGQCHALALCLHYRFGWELVGQWWGFPSEQSVPDHILVLHPNGRVLDIRGFKRFNSTCHQVMSLDQVESLEDRGYWEPDLDNARDFLDIVVDTYCANMLV